MAVATSMASMTRESSPPDAALVTARGAVPDPDASRISMSSRPSVVNRPASSTATDTVAEPIARWLSSSVMRAPSAAAAVRAGA